MQHLSHYLLSSCRSAGIIPYCNDYLLDFFLSKMASLHCSNRKCTDGCLITVSLTTAAVLQVVDFKAGAVWRVMVASYETLRKHTDALAGCVDLLVCDEGHRLKAAAGNKTINALLALRCPRRILVTGTPLQNNLEEFFGGSNPLLR